MQVRQLLRRLFWPLPVLLLLAGCAKSPSGGGTSPVSGPQLLVTMTVAGTLNPNYYYYVLFNVNNAPGPANTSVTGPVPVVTNAFNTGNGYAAGAFTNYVEYNATQPGGTSFNYYIVSPNLLQSTPLGQARLIQAQAVGSTLTFQLPLAYLATSSVTADQINSLQVNFIATNIVPVGTQNLNATKYFDALYPPEQAGNSYVNLIIRGAGGTLMPGIYSNSTTSVGETAGDVATLANSGVVAVPRPAGGTTSDGVAYDDLDITNWSITLNAQ